jgi:hypothetical protein
MPFAVTRSGRTRKPPERLIDFSAVPVETRMKSGGAQSLLELTNGITELASRLNKRNQSREIQTGTMHSDNMKVEIPDPSALEGLLDLSGLSDFGSPERTSTADQSPHQMVETEEKSLLDKVEWPTVMDGNTGGKANRIGKLPIRMGYKDIKMERISPIRIC